MTSSERCTRGCESLKAELSSCEARVSSRTRTQETCAQELLDLIHCQDHCMHKLYLLPFSYLALCSLL
ncbi:unnamed protein product [Lampetra planeri]